MDGEKMSKTKGNVANPFDLVDWFGKDAVRWFLLKEIALGADGNYSEEALINRTNVDLANDLGNTLSRVARIVATNLDGRVPGTTHPEGLAEVAGKAWTGWVEGFESGEPQAALRSTWELLDATNKFLVREEPWKLAKDEAQRERFEGVMHDAAEALRHVALQISPAIPDTTAKIFAVLGLGDPAGELPFDPEGEIPWGFPQGGDGVAHGEPLFPRIDKKAFFGEQAKAGESKQPKKQAKQAKKPQEKKSVSETESNGIITIDDVMKVQLRTAVVKSAEKHPDADKLIVLQLDDGSGEPRTICAGIAAFYAPEDLVNKTIVVVANLKPRKLRGIPSQGMLLAANHGEGEDEKVQVITLPDGTPPGAEVR
jgi:methionyl-tRNA synthetase